MKRLFLSVMFLFIVSEFVSALSLEQSNEKIKELWKQYQKQISISGRSEWDNKKLVLHDHEMKFEFMNFGEKPEEGWSLYISMHGGGQTSKAINDGQWRNQIGLYQTPLGSIYLVPRAPTDTWNMWHQSHIDQFYDRLITYAILFEGVNPNKVYLLGYSAGGDGVYQLAPRFADRLAAAAMMAGHPNEASPLGLRNIGFSLHMGEKDSGYKRNKVAIEWKKKLTDLKKSDPEGYPHEVIIYEGYGHNLKREEASAIPWMAKFKREPLPSKVVWRQDDVHHSRYYWLANVGEIETGSVIIAERNKQEIRIESVDGIQKIKLLLNDSMLDLDQPIKVIYKDSVLYEGIVSRSAAVIQRTIEERGDPDLIFCAELVIELEQGKVGSVIKNGAENYSETILAAFDKAGENWRELNSFLGTVKPEHSKAAFFLIENMPEQDLQTLTCDFLKEQVELAFQSWEAAPWHDQVPEQLFLNYILPYANLNEKRDNWRADFMDQLKEKAWSFKTPLEATAWLNMNLNDLFKVYFHATKRPKADQSPYESIEAGFASCTGLSILLSDACRSVGIPARIVGVPKWTKENGNHNWVEAWDGQWHLIGDTGSDPRGHSWVEDRAKNQTDPDDPLHHVYAASFAKTDLHFPLVWDWNITYVSGKNITRFYTDSIDYTLEIPDSLTGNVKVEVFWDEELVTTKTGEGNVKVRLANKQNYKINFIAEDQAPVMKDLHLN